MASRLSELSDALKHFVTTLKERGILKGLRIASKVVWNLFLIFIISGMMIIFFAAGVGMGYFASLVKDEEIRSYESMKKDIYNYEETSHIYFSDQQLLGDLRSDLDREEIALDQVSKYAIDAIIATEDNYFYDHRGIVPKAIARAIFQELTNSERRTGGSTLTQQLVKNQILTNEVSFERKAKEILLALRLERFFDKDEILEAYLNIVPFGRDATGRNIAGIEAAAEGIFGVSAKHLNLPQAAFIAGLPQNPYVYTPFNNDGSLKNSLEAGINRMHVVLSRMLTEGFIDEQQYNQALAYDIKANFAQPKETPVEKYPYLHFEVERRASEVIAKMAAEEDGHDGQALVKNYILYDNLNFESRNSTTIYGKEMTTEEIAKEKNIDFNKVEKDYQLFVQYLENASNDIRKNGYHIHTTIDQEIYDAWNKAKNEVENDRRYFQAPKSVLVTDPETGEKQSKEYPMQVGAMLIENRTGRIISFVGGKNYDVSQLNHATQAYRPNGSTMKPLLDYAPAMELGKIQPGYILADTPLTEIKGWNPKNYSGDYKGLMTARDALKQSQNIPAIRTFLRMDAYEATSYLEKMGFTSLVGGDRTNPSMSIGSLTRGVTVEENTNAFATFANGGKFINAYMIEKIVSSDGDIIYEHKSEPVDVFSPQTAYLTIDMMRDVIYDGGTASRLPGYLTFRSDWAGKTGTSQNWEDSWFVATNPNVTLGVWTGYDKPMRLDTRNYSQRTQRLWALFANAAYDVNSKLMDPDERFAMPSGIVRRSICGISGLLPSDLCKQAGLVKTDLFHAKYVPNETDDSLTKIRYVVMKNKSYEALDSTPTEFTKTGVKIKPEYVKGVNVIQLLPDNWDSIEGIAAQKASENGKRPNPVTGVRINGGRLSWSEHPERDIVGYRIYQAANETNRFTKIGSIATFENTTSLSISGNTSAYYVTAVDVAGNESSPSKIVTVGNWSDRPKNNKPEQEYPDSENRSGNADQATQSENDHDDRNEEAKPTPSS